jgi:hypothetical protein
MSRIPEVSLEDVTDAIPPALVAAMMGRDRPRSAHAQMAHAPAVLAAYMGVRGALNEHSTLAPRDRSAITLAVAGSDECDYGRAVTANVAHRAGWADGEIAAIDQGDPVGDDPIDALLDVARQAARHTGRVKVIELGMAPIRRHPAIPRVWTAVTPDGGVQGVDPDEALAVLAELTWWSATLRDGRDADTATTASGAS